MKITSKTFLSSLKSEPIKTLDTLHIDNIITLIQNANYAYYNTGKPIISDDIYELVKEYVQKKVPNHPILSHVGAPISLESKKVELPYYMGSLDKIKNDDKSLYKWSNDHPGKYVVSDKLDGVSALLCITYENNEYHHKLYSRGDGTTGQDISHLLPFLQNTNINYANLKPKCLTRLAIRGELVLSKEDFEYLHTKGANPRNMVSGIVNAKLPDLEVTKNIQFIAYELIEPQQFPSDQYRFLEEIGCKVVYNTVCESLSSELLSNILVERRKTSEFEIDGIVIIHNAVYIRSENNNPSYAFAFKSIHTMDSAEVIVKEVEWNLSKDGYFKPVVIFDEVYLSGVMVKRANGNNGKFIQDNKIGPGSRTLWRCYTLYSKCFIRICIRTSTNADYAIYMDENECRYYG